MVLKECHSKTTIDNDVNFNVEKKEILTMWGEGLEDAEVEAGNSYFVKERVRWLIF
jgi:hypothetical protein